MRGRCAKNYREAGRRGEEEKKVGRLSVDARDRVVGAAAAVEVGTGRREGGKWRGGRWAVER